MKVKYEKGLILADILIEFREATKTISNRLIDTGAARTLILQDVVDDTGVNVTTRDNCNLLWHWRKRTCF